MEEEKGCAFFNLLVWHVFYCSIDFVRLGNGWREKGRESLLAYLVSILWDSFHIGPPK
jgi:hypothetical protein